MLAPHYGKDSELGKVRFTTEDFLDALEFFRRQAVFRHEFRSYFRIGGVRHRHRTLTKEPRDTTRSFLIKLEYEGRSWSLNIEKEGSEDETMDFRRCRIGDFSLRPKCFRLSGRRCFVQDGALCAQSRS